MLQQTRVAAVIPYYERFLARFPDVESLANAAEADLLAMWAGLGYYSRARNLQKAAHQMGGRFPQEHSAIRALAGIGDYTAAAVASIAFGLPHAVLDGNVLRVLSRLTAEPGDIGSPATRKKLQAIADGLLAQANPGDFNQSLMELGATVCLPRDPQCLLCPLAGFCEAKRTGRQNQYPVKLRRKESVKVLRTVLVIKQKHSILMWQRALDSGKLAGFWELPGPDLLPAAVMQDDMGNFRHSITNHNYTFRVVRAKISCKPANFEWIQVDRLGVLPVSTTARKALALAANQV